MVTWALGFLAVAVLAVLFHVSGIVLTSAAAAQLVFVVSLIFFALSLLAGVVRRV